MLFIDSNWKQYFTDRHEGLGTTYERFILHKYFREIKDKYSIQNILEAPCFGMTGVSGINSLWWAYENSKITIVDHNKERINLIKKVWQELSANADFSSVGNGYSQLPFEDDAFDLGWNFAALSYVSDLKSFLKELSRVCRKAIFICIPNRSNLFYRLRMIPQKKSDGVNTFCINSSNIEKIMLGLNWDTAEHGYFDVPLWPDIAMKKEDLLMKINLGWLAEKLTNRDGNCLSIIDYFNGNNINMEKEIMKYGLLEDAPLFFQKFWAHHQYFLFVPKEGLLSDGLN